MNRSTETVLAFGLAISLASHPTAQTPGGTSTRQMSDATSMHMQKVDQVAVDRALMHWKEKPKELAKKLIGKYGLPHEATSMRLIWMNNGPWKWSELVNEEITHNFPMPHKDMLYQAIDYRIDPDDADELGEYDGSVILERTKGEIAARCDKEEANFLAINLANDVAMGKRSVNEARRYYAEAMMAMMKEGKQDDYLRGFRFSMMKGDTADPDKPWGPMGTTGQRPPRE